jgi:hypothetical protein
MRINGPGSTALARESQAPRRAASGAFRLDEGEGAQTHNVTSGIRGLAGIDALVALQGVEDATERRRRAVGRGRRALDALDEVKLGLIGGQLDPSIVGRLKALSADLKQGTGDQGLDAVLAEIDLRVEVEIAKMTRR